MLAKLKKSGMCLSSYYACANINLLSKKSVPEFSLCTGLNLFNSFSAGAIFCNPHRGANDEFICHAQATLKNADDVYTRHKLSIQKYRWRTN